MLHIERQLPTKLDIGTIAYNHLFVSRMSHPIHHFIIDNAYPSLNKVFNFKSNTSSFHHSPLFSHVYPINHVPCVRPIAQTSCYLHLFIPDTIIVSMVFALLYSHLFYLFASPLFINNKITTREQVNQKVFYCCLHLLCL